MFNFKEYAAVGGDFLAQIDTFSRNMPPKATIFLRFIFLRNTPPKAAKIKGLKFKVFGRRRRPEKV